MSGIVFRQSGFDLHDPFVQHPLWARIQGGEGADETRFALLDDQFGSGGDKHGGADDG